MQKSKIQSLQSRVYIANPNLESFSSQRFDSALKLSYAKSFPLFLSSFICKKHLFLFNILFQSHLIRHSSSQNIFKDTQRALGHSQGTWALKSLGHTTTQRVLGHSEDTWAPEHLRHLGTRALRHLNNWRFRVLRHLAPQGTRTLGHLGIRGALLSRFL